MHLFRSAYILIIFITISFHTTLASATECSVESGKNRVALLELYTSEGCSSCPPADKWLGNLSKRKIGLDKVVPLSFHVDYWNYIGWRDPYSSSEYTQRQRQVAQRNRLRSIYTPQLVFNGRDYRGWRSNNINSLLKKVNTWPATAKLSFHWQSIAKNTLSASITSELTNKKVSKPTLVVALYENSLVSNVTAGENDGRSLRHDYVVRKIVAIPFSGKLKMTNVIELQIEEGWNKKNLGLAVFVQQANDGSILQALASPLDCQS